MSGPNTITLVPDKIEIIYVVFVAVIKPYLVPISVVLQLPVRRRSDDKMNRLVFEFAHVATVTDDYSCFWFHSNQLVEQYPLFGISIVAPQSGAPMPFP